MFFEKVVQIIRQKSGTIPVVRIPKETFGESLPFIDAADSVRLDAADSVRYILSNDKVCRHFII